jgi:NADH-quinone oxidoreductase subunit J
VFSAVRVITHSRPVYSALYFVLTVLSTCGLLLLLEAEFMAFATIIIYAGAILVTYLFVIMLATMPQVEGQVEEAPVYDRAAREPLSAVVLGFALIAVLSNVIFSTNTELVRQNPTAPQFVAIETTVQYMPDRVREALLAGGYVEDAEALSAMRLMMQDQTLLGYNDSRARVMAIDLTELENLALADELAAPNIDQVGIGLFVGHELGIELAGIILLLSMVGAIVIGRKQVEKIAVAVNETGGDEATRDSMDQIEPGHEPGPGEPGFMGDVSGSMNRG